jgi:hypothetical protein
MQVVAVVVTQAQVVLKVQAVQVVVVMVVFMHQQEALVLQIGVEAVAVLDKIRKHLQVVMAVQVL